MTTDRDIKRAKADRQRAIRAVVQHDTTRGEPKSDERGGTGFNDSGMNLRALGRLVPLTREQEVKAILLAQRGDGPEADAAKTRLLQSHHRLILKMAYAKLERGAVVTDFFMAGVAAYFHALTLFDPSRGVRLWSYVKIAVEGAILGVFREQQSAGDLSIDEEIRPPGGSSDDDSMKGDTKHEMIADESKTFTHQFDALAGARVSEIISMVGAKLDDDERVAFKLVRGQKRTQTDAALILRVDQSTVSRMVAKGDAICKRLGLSLDPKDHVLEPQSTRRFRTRRGRTQREVRH